VNKISENYFLKDRYTATFGKNILGNNVTCKVTDKQTIGHLEILCVCGRPEGFGGCSHRGGELVVIL
jgi:hypothetical protein